MRWRPVLGVCEITHSPHLDIERKLFPLRKMIFRKVRDFLGGLEAETSPLMPECGGGGAGGGG